MSILNILNSAALGSALQTLTREAKKTASSAGKNAPGGVGGLLGAGMLGALLGKGASSDLVKNAALVGVGAVAWNFYQKWAQAKAEQAVPEAQGRQSAPAQNSPWGCRPRADQWQAQTPMVMQLDPTALLVMRAMIFAARADGSVDALEQQRIDTLIQNMLQGQDVRAQLDAMESEMLDPRKIASAVQGPEQGEDIYRLSCVVIDIDHFMERSYLDALGDALGIGPARRAELEADAAQGRRQLQAAAMA